MSATRKRFIARVLAGACIAAAAFLPAACTLFAPSYSLVVLVSLVEGGTVTRSPDQAVSPKGTVVTITATAATGYVFAGWRGDYTGLAGSGSVVMDQDRTVIAEFTRVTTEERALSVIVSPPAGGSVTSTTGGPVYPKGTEVTLTAIPATGYSFQGWSGAVSGRTNPMQIAMDDHRLVYAEFVPILTDHFGLTVLTAPPGAGTVAATPAASAYDPGTIVSLQATPSSGYVFTGWSGKMTGASNPENVTMDSDKLMYAQFEKIRTDERVLSLYETPSGGGTVSASPAGPSYAPDTLVTITAVPGSGYCFKGWFGGLIGTATPVQVTMSVDKLVYAEFAPITTAQHALTVVVAPPDSGTVSASPSAALYDTGTTVSLTASPASGYAFVGWSGKLTGNENPGSVLMDQDRTVHAQFVRLQADQQLLTVTVTPPGGGTVAVNPAGLAYDLGTIVTLTATPTAGFTFFSWSGALSGSTNPTTVQMSAAKDVTAIFQPQNGGGSVQGTPLNLSRAVSTLSGAPGQSDFFDGTGTGALFDDPAGVVVVGGYAYIADRDNHRIRRMDLATCAVTTVSGTGTTGGHVDGSAAYARFNLPFGICSDGTWLYVTEVGSHVVRRVSIADGSTLTIAGRPGSSGSADNADGSLATFNYPAGICYVAGSPNALYVSDYNNYVVRKIELTAPFAVSTFAGTQGNNAETDGTGAVAAFSYPHGMATNGTVLWVSDASGQRIREITIPGAVVTTRAGTGATGQGDTVGSSATFNSPVWLAYAPGTLYISENGSNYAVRSMSVSAPYTVATLTGGHGSGSTDGSHLVAQFAYPAGIAISGASLFLCDMGGNHTIRKIAVATGMTSTVAGSTGRAFYSDGAGIGAMFAKPSGICTDGTWLYVTENDNHVIRRVDPATGAATVFAGLPKNADYLDGAGTGAKFHTPNGITIGGATLYICDSSNNRIRAIDIASQTVTTIAGGAAAGAPGYLDDTGTSARFSYPFGITTDGTYLYVCDNGNNVIRKISLSAPYVVTTLAGIQGSTGYGYDNGPGTTARFSNTGLYGITTDGTSLYVADQGNAVIRKVNPATGETSLLAGMHGVLGHADGAGANARFRQPRDLATDGTYLYVTDFADFTVRRVLIATGAVDTVAGHDSASGYANGTGDAARFDGLAGVCTDGTRLFLCDLTNHVIRVIQ